MIAALDVGTSKIACFLARHDVQAGMRIVGIGQEISDGLRAGSVIDMDAAERAIRTAVHRAEIMANEHVESVFVSLSGGTPQSDMVEVGIGVGGGVIEERDIQRAFDEVDPSRGETDIVHAIPVGYELDGSAGIRDPRGMHGDRLKVRLHLVRAAHGSLRNLLGCVKRSDLDVDAPVVAAYASGLGCLVADEMDLGVTFIDMGGGTTDLAVFAEGKLVWTEMLPIGGAHVTNDIARGLSTPLASAERMKRLYASALPDSSDDSEMIEVPELGQNGAASGRQVARSLLGGVVRPRIEEILELARDRLESSGAGERAGRRVVISGGASQLQGLGELAERVMDRQIRIARPLPLPGLAEAVSGPEFAACAGLLVYATQKHTEPGSRSVADDGPLVFGSALGRIGQWLRSNF